MTPAITTLRVTPLRERADEWSLVLSSAGILHRVQVTPEGFTIYVTDNDAARANDALLAYERENPPPVAPDATLYGSTWLGALVAVALVAFFFYTGERSHGSRLFERGSADAARILAGEPWRVITALTLHADLAHVVGNAVASLVFLTAVAQWIGPGVTAWLVLLTGAVGTVLTALVHRTNHISVGASTAMFGALGMLGALQLVSRSRHGAPGRRAWVAVAASVILLGLLGTGERADLFAHGFGFLTGGVLGVAIARLHERPFSPLVERSLASVCGVFVVWVWLWSARPM